MNQIRSRFRRLMMPCPKCKGSGQSGVFKKHLCSKCGGTGQIKTRPCWVGPAVVGGMIFSLFILWAIASLTAKPATAAESSQFGTFFQSERSDGIIPSDQSDDMPSPIFDIKVEIVGGGTEESETEQGAECHVSPSYPQSIMQWCELITKYAHANDIPSDMIAAVMLQESGGDPNIRSYCDATGLMQIMPRDLTEKTILCGALNCINGHCFANRPTIEELYDPAFNIDYGAGLLAEKYNYFGDWRDALKAYGPMDIGYSYADNVLTIFENYK